MDPLPISTLTPLGLLCFVLAFPYLQIARGKLVPQSTVDRMIAEHEREVARMIAEHEREVEDIAHDRTEWRAAHRISEAARVQNAEQVDKLIASAQVTEAFLRALPRPDVRQAP